MNLSIPNYLNVVKGPIEGGIVMLADPVVNEQKLVFIQILSLFWFLLTAFCPETRNKCDWTC